MNAVNPLFLPALVQALVHTRPDEHNCEECCEEMSLYAERCLADPLLAATMPRIHEHLERCRDCNEEFNALVKALEHSAVQSST